MSLAPIAFFAYNRPRHMERTLQSLADNDLAASSDLYIFMDGPKGEEDRPATEEVRKVAASRQWCGTVHLVGREKNLGLSESIIQGVTQLCESRDRVIVLEDDLILSPIFLDYMNVALDLYEADSEVFQISGFQFPVDIPGNDDTFFARMGTSWGWATWHRAWSTFDRAGAGYQVLEMDRKLQNRFDLEGAYPFFSMLKQWREGENDSWAIRFYLHMFLHDGLALHPRRSLVGNLGLDNSGTHCRSDDPRGDSIPERELPKTFPSAKEEDAQAYAVIRGWLQGQQVLKPSFLSRIKAVVCSLRSLSGKRDERC